MNSQRIDELERNLNNDFYRKINEMQHLEEKHKYESTQELLNFKNKIDQILQNQKVKLENEQTKTQEIDHLHNKLTAITTELDTIIFEKTNAMPLPVLQREELNVTSSSLNIDQEILKEIDRNINEINKKENTEIININDDTYDFTLEDLKPEIKNNNSKSNVFFKVFIVILIIIIIFLVIFFYNLLV